MFNWSLQQFAFLFQSKEKHHNWRMSLSPAKHTETGLRSWLRNSMRISSHTRTTASIETGDTCRCSSWTIVPSIAQQWYCTHHGFFSWASREAPSCKVMRCSYTLIILWSGLLISGLGQPWPFIISCLLLMCYWLFLHSTVCSGKKMRCRQRLIDKGRADYHLDSMLCRVVFLF